jgi:glycosyltransferase involved in cell wall biosynthesis
MKVAFDARMVHYRRAGIGQYAINILRALARSPEVDRSARFDVLQMSGHPEPIVEDRRFKRVPMRTPPHNRVEQLALGIELLKLRPTPDLIHSPDFVPPRFRRYPAVVNIQDLAFLKFPELTLLTDESKRYYGQVEWAAHNAECLIALSNSARDDMVSLLNVSPAKIAVIPGAAADEFKSPADLHLAQTEAARIFNLPAPEEGGYILFVSTIEPRKNLVTLLEAYNLLLGRKVSPQPVLAVAGREGWLFEHVHARMSELNLQGRVKLLGEVPGERLIKLYQGARLFALPSIYEGFGLSALEAMACGVPVVASTGGSLPEVVGNAGLLVEPRDVDGWAAALERLLSDPPEERRLREAGPVQAAQFSWDKAAAQTWDLYRRITA